MISIVMGWHAMFCYLRCVSFHFNMFTKQR